MFYQSQSDPYIKGCGSENVMSGCLQHEAD